MEKWEYFVSEFRHVAEMLERGFITTDEAKNYIGKVEEHYQAYLNPDKKADKPTFEQYDDTTERDYYKVMFGAGGHSGDVQTVRMTEREFRERVYNGEGIYRDYYTACAVSQD